MYFSHVFNYFYISGRVYFININIFVSAETIRKMLADLPAKRHRVMVNPLNSFPRKKHSRKCNSLMMKKRSFDDQNYINSTEESSTTEGSDTFSSCKANDYDFNNDDEDDDDDLPLKPKMKTTIRSLRQKESLNKKAIMNRSKRKSIKEINLPTENSNEDPIDHASSIQPMELSIDNTPNRVNINGGTNNVREHSNRGGSNNRDNERPGSSRQNGNANESAAPTQNVPLKHSIARLTADSETQDKAVQFHRLFLVQQECNNLDQRHLPSDRRLLFENEAVVTKLDKPPLHFNPKEASDLQQQRKNKLNKPRKRLNDCIAMLKNKLTPSNDNNIPGHVSVQCGSDEPIEQEPFMIEQSLKIIEPSEEMAINSTMLPQVSLQELTFKETSTEHTCSTQLDKTSPKNSSNSENCLLLHSQNEANDEFKMNQEDSSVELSLKHAPTKSDSTILSNVPISEIENSQADVAPLSLPRNTVIRKSPKISVNCANPQEEVRVLKSTHQFMEGVSNDYANRDVNNIKSNELPAIVLDVTSESNEKSQPLFKSLNDDLIDPSQFSSTKKYDLTLTTELNLEESLGNSAKELQIEQFIDKTPKDDLVDHTSNDFHDTPCTIPPAHASTNVESIISTPLDLSGKKSRTVNTNEDVAFINNYDSYETLDLSNKSLSADQPPIANLLNDTGSNEVVDLSIKSKFTNLKRTVTLLDNEIVGDVSYETINDNLPTDLSLKKNNITSSIGLTSQSCENVAEFVQDLSSHKTKQREIVQERSLNIEYNVKELPTNLSSDGINDSSLIIEIIDNETDDSSDQDPNKESQFNISRYLPQNDGDNTTGINATGEIVKPHDDIKNDHINLDVQDKMNNFTVESKNNDKSVTHIQLPRNLSHLNISPCITNRSEINDARDMSKSITTTMAPKCEIVKNQHITTFVDNTISVTKDTIRYDIENSMFNVSNVKESSLTLYSNKERVSSQLPDDKFEGSSTICTPTYDSISVAIADKTSSPPLVTSFPSIPSAQLPSMAPIHTGTGTSVNSNINIIDLSSETENSKAQKVLDTCEIVNEHYDLTKEEIIDCDLEQDTETAKKIAMLPKELVKILGKMPMDHRKQLLDVLPQYVSPSASFGLGESIANQRSNISKTRSPSPTKQQAVPIRHSFDEESHKDLIQNNKNLCYETRSQPQPNTCVASSSSIQSFPKSVILKTPVATNDINQSVPVLSNQELTPIIPSELNRSVSVLNRPSKLTFEEVQNMIIDLTEDENIQETRYDEQMKKNNLLAVKEGSTQNQAVQFLSESPSQKGYSEQTASLRAVRIKAPSERNKKAASDYRVESHCESNAVNSNDYTSGQNLNIDVLNVDQPRVDMTKVCNEQATHISVAEVYVSPVKESDGTESFEQQSNPSGNILSKSSVILTPASLEKNVKVSLGKRYGKRMNISCFSENSTQKSSEKQQQEAERDNNLMTTVLSTDDIPCSSTQFKEKTTNDDEDSDDDVSLAVIVQQKQREQAQISSDNNSLSTKSDVAVCKRKKKDKSKTVFLNNARNNDEIAIGNQTNAEEKRVEASLELTETLVPNPNASKTQDYVTCANLETEENYTSTERRKRKVKNRRDTGASVEFFEQSEKIDSTIAQIKGNIASKSDLPITVFQDTSKKIVKESFRRTSDSSVDVSSTSIEYGENFEIHPHMNVEVVNRQSLEKTKENKNLEKNNGYEELGREEYNKDEDDVCNSAHVEPTNIVDSEFQDLSPLDLENSQTKQDNGREGKHILPDTDFKCKKSSRVKKPKNNDSTDSHESQPLVTFQAEENSITPLRRSRRGKSMFVDNTVVEPVIPNQDEVIVDKKTPLTKKQLIFSKLLLDEENVTKPVLSSVIAKNPIVVISNVDLSSHLSSPPQKDKKETQSSLIDCTKPIKSSKRKKSPQTKRKSKKLKSLNNVPDESVYKSVALNNDEQKNKSDCEQSPDKTVQSCNVDLVRNYLLASTIEQEKDTNCDIIETSNENILNSEEHVGQKIFGETSTKSTTIEKRKISCSLTNADGNCASTSKKTKLDSTIKLASKNNVVENRATNESCRNSRGRTNNDEILNQTCYNTHVAVRRTRSKSVVVKSSTPLYDPYDIELEDMVEEDEPIRTRIKSTDITLKKLSIVRDNEMKKINKRETSVVVNTKPINIDTVYAQTSNNIELKEDANDSDDSSKSDVPLKKYVEEKEKKNLELSGSNINESNNASTNENHETDNIAEKREEKLEDKSSSSQQENNQEQKSDQFMESFGFFSERKPRKSNIIATQKIAETFHAIETDEVNEEDKQEPVTTESDTKNREESVCRDTSLPSPPPPSPSRLPSSSPSLSRNSGKLESKKPSYLKPLPCYCRICKNNLNAQVTF